MCVSKNCFSKFEIYNFFIFRNQCRYLASKSNETLVTDSLDWIGLEKRIDHNNNLSDNKNQEELASFIPGGGVAQKFFKASKENDINAFVLLIFAHEGNNIPESIQLVNYLNEWKAYLNKVV